MNRLLAITVSVLLTATTAHAQATFYVDEDGYLDAECSSWEDACPDLQTAFDLAEPGDQIWIATNKAAYEVERGRAADSRLAGSAIFDGVEIYGGFDGTEDTLQDRAALRTRTISGDVDDAEGDPVRADMYEMDPTYSPPRERRPRKRIFDPEHLPQPTQVVRAIGEDVCVSFACPSGFECAVDCADEPVCNPTNCAESVCSFDFECTGKDDHCETLCPDDEPEECPSECLSDSHCPDGATCWVIISQCGCPPGMGCGTIYQGFCSH